MQVRIGRVVGACAAATLIAWALWPEGDAPPAVAPLAPPPSPALHRAEAPPVSPRTAEPTLAAAEAVALEPTAFTPRSDVEQPRSDSEPHDDHELANGPDSDLPFYADYPMSDVPHSVVRGWGARDRDRLGGAVGAFVVVDASLSDAELERLVLDIDEYHRSAPAVSVRIMDSAEAAVYDRHVDGGELASQHLVGTVSRNDLLGTKLLEVRGRILEGDD